MSVRIVLAPEGASVPLARRFVADQLADLPPATVDLARLLVSEVVTNAVLHARTETTLTLDWNESTVKIQVADTNPVLPVVRSHGAEAGTGRGLHVLDRLASNWGTEPLRGGKVVWFEIPATMDSARLGTLRAGGESGNEDLDTAGKDGTAGAPHSGAVRDRRPRRSRGSKPAPGNLVEFRWVSLPVARLDAMAEHYDAVLREFHLVLEREPAARAAVPGRLIALMDELTKFAPLISRVERDLETARRARVASVDVALDLPIEIGPLALRLDNLLDETDAYCGAGVELLSLEPTNDVVTLRKWLIGELVRQAEGQPALGWPASPWATSPGKRRDRAN
jgi:hypothetical protein